MFGRKVFNTVTGQDVYENDAAVQEGLAEGDFVLVEGFNANGTTKYADVRLTAQLGDVIQVDQVYNQSTGDLMDRDVDDGILLDTEELVDAANEMIQGRVTLGKFLEEVDPTTEDYYAEFAGTFSHGRSINGTVHTSVFQVPFGDDPDASWTALGDPVARAATAHAIANVHDTVILADNPTPLPFSNLDLNPATNPGDEGQCLARFYDIPARLIDVPTLNESFPIAMNARPNTRYVVYDFEGNIIRDSHPGTTNRPTTKSGLLFGGHMNKIVKYTKKRDAAGNLIQERLRAPIKPQLVKNKKSITLMGDSPEAWLEERGYVYWKDGFTYLTPEGRFGPDPTALDWERKLEFMIPIKYTTMPAQHILNNLKRSVAPFNYNAPNLPKTELIPDDWFHLDAAKCYYSCFRFLLDHDGGWLLPDAYSHWIPFEESHRKRAAMFKVPPAELPTYCRTNLIATALLSLFPGATPTHTMLLGTGKCPWDSYPTECVYEKGKPIERLAPIRTRIVEFCKSDVDDQYDQAFDIDGEPRLDPDGEYTVVARAKTFAHVNGRFGKTDTPDRVKINLPLSTCQTEVEHYRDMYGFDISRGGNVLVRSEAVPKVTSRYYMYLSVVHLAKYFVARKIQALERSFSMMPVYIRTDGLIYGRNPAMVDFYNTGKMNEVRDEELVMRWINKDAPSTFRPMSLRKLADTDIDPPEYHNDTLIGPPGVGKTYAGMSRPGATPMFDEPHRLATSYNRGKTRLAADAQKSAVPGQAVPIASTMYGLISVDINLKPSDLFEARNRLPRGTVVLCDESQGLPAVWWSIMYMLYERGVRFRFCCDPNQVGAIECAATPGVQAPAEPTAFHGTVHRMTVDHRNDQSLVDAREQVLAQTFNPELAAYDAPLDTELHLAFRNATCNYINYTYAKHNNKTFGGDGVYTVTKAYRTTAVEVDIGEAVRREGTKMTKISSGVEFHMVSLTACWEWAWARTIHSCIGETYLEPYTIWEMDTLDRQGYGTTLKYTALTRGTNLSQVRFRGVPPLNVRLQHQKRPR